MAAILTFIEADI